MHSPTAHHPNAHPTSRWARLTAVLVAAALALLGLTVAAAPATAAEIPGAITRVSTDKSTYGYSEKLTLTFDWSVPDGSEPGDTFRLDLPDELAAVSLARFPLVAADGSTVANAVWDGKAVVFTLTDYVTSHEDVSGSGFLTVQWDHARVTETGGPVVLTFTSNLTTVTIDPKPAPCTDCAPAPVRTERGIWKGSSWADGAYEGTRDEKDNINWLVEVPGDQIGYEGPVVVEDAVGAGSVIDCSTLTVTTQDSLAGGAPTRALDPSRYTLDCRDGGFTLTLDRVDASEFVNVAYKGTITDQSAGRYSNTVTITTPGKTWTKDSIIGRTDAGGGTGGGVQSVAVGDLVWLDANHDGLQGADEAGIPGVTLVLTGPGGEPVTDVNGKRVAPAVTGADGHYLFAGLPVLPAGQHYTVSLDATASGSALAGLAATTAGAGDDRASDSSTESAESADLVTNGAKDLTLDFGFARTAEPAGPASPANPSTPAPAPTPQPSAAPATAATLTSDALAHTGLDVALPAALAAALALLGGAALLLRRKRQVG